MGLSVVIIDWVPHAQSIITTPIPKEPGQDA
jgi:hypothetical protein